MISLFYCLFLGALSLVCLYLYLTWNFNYWKKKGIACDENPSIIFGSIMDTMLGRKQWGQIYTELYDKYPKEKVVGWFKFRTPGLIIRDPELIRKVLVNDFNYFRNNDFVIDPEADPIMAANLFSMKDDPWRKRRALVTPAFTAGKIKAIYPMMGQVAQDLVKFLNQHPEELDVKSVMSRYTSEVVARCGFGIDGNNLIHPKPEMHEMGKKIFESSTARNLKFMSFLMMPKVARLLKLKLMPDEVLNFFYEVLRDVFSHRQQNNTVRNDVINYWIEVKKKSMEVAKGNIQSEILNKEYTDEDILSGCIMFFVESYETSANVLSNILYLLATHKDVQESLRREIDETLQDGELTFEKLHAMSYLHSVFAESVRLLPVLFASQKICTERYEMDIGKNKPLVIEVGTPIAIPTFSLQNDPAYWDDPDSFKPERFFSKEVETNAKNKGIYMPFLDGPRVCPGSRIAATLLKLALVQIISQMEVHPTSKTPKKIDPDPTYFMIAHKGGMYLRFVERSR